MKIHVLMSPGCSHGESALRLVADVLRQEALVAEVETIWVATLEDAERLSYPGSPTIRVDGLDIDPKAPTTVGLS